MYTVFLLCVCVSEIQLQFLNCKGRACLMLQLEVIAGLPFLELVIVLWFGPLLRWMLKHVSWNKFHFKKEQNLPKPSFCRGLQCDPFTKKRLWKSCVTSLDFYKKLRWCPHHQGALPCQSGLSVWCLKILNDSILQDPCYLLYNRGVYLPSYTGIIRRHEKGSVWTNQHNGMA